jgi:arylsulfatase A-like enzyme
MMKAAAFWIVILFCSMTLQAQVTPQEDMPRNAPSSTQPAIIANGRPIPAIHRALVISIDGLRPDLLLRANTPTLHRLFQSGSFSFWARTTAVSITLPSHTSMLTGATPNRHGILWNSDLPFVKPVYPSVPTLFEVAHRAGYTTAMVAGKMKFDTLAKPKTLDYFHVPATQKSEDSDVIDHAIEIIRWHKPEVMFVHFPSVDNVGHKIGWGTPQQIKAIETADGCVGRLLSALDEAGVADSTFVLVTADHGGAGRTHGPDDPRSRHIPWIAVGPGIRKNLDLTTFPRLNIDTEDTFATVCWLLAIPVDPKNLDGKPITEIMERNELLRPTADITRP